MLDKAEEESRKSEEGGGEKQILPGAALGGLNIKNKSHNSFFFYYLLSCLFTYFSKTDCPTVLQPSTPVPYIQVGLMHVGEVAHVSQLIWKRLIVFYFYHETHRGMMRRVCGWKSFA